MTDITLSMRACTLAAATAAEKRGGVMFTDGWPGFETPDGWRYRVAYVGRVWVAMHHTLGKTGCGTTPEQAREQALVRECD
jgi:hypothetical protein